LQIRRLSERAEIVKCSGGDGATIFEHACKLGFEGIMSKRRDRPCRSGPSKAWLKVKNPAAAGVLRFEDRTRDLANR
jgi:ATP-dependent DNA ligase